MNWNDHSKDFPEGSHAPFGASNPFWINYDEERALLYYKNILAKTKGTKLHDLAKRCIEEKIQLKGRNTLARYTNDAIGFRMRPEQALVYSSRFAGTADSIIFNNDLLRIHDLKTGQIPGKIEQLMIYDALFCLEYGVDPREINHELRIYQNNDVNVVNPETDDIIFIMEKAKALDKVIKDYQEDQLT